MKFFTRSYSSVQTEDDQPQQQQNFDKMNPAAVAAILTEAQQRRKSLKANRSMNTAGILNSFFTERQIKSGRVTTRSPKCAFLLLAIGVLAITTAILVKVFHPYDLIFRYKLKMEKGGEVFNLWEKPPVDLYIKIYLFNITNAEAFLAGREKMHVEQVGPYVYKELMTHENVTFNANNTMSTEPAHPLVWQEHLSEGHKEDDQVVMLNIAMLAISHLMANKHYFVRTVVNSFLSGTKSEPIVRMTAKEFMFGYPTTLTTLGNTFLPNWIHFESVGLIDRMYDFDTDYETFYTGVPNPELSGLYATYRGSTDLPHWHGKHCSNIEQASDGTKFKSQLKPNETVKFFRKSMCRPINLHRVGEAKKVGSLNGYSYVFEENALDNGNNNEENKCFCRNGYCQPKGLLDVTDCYYGFPISLSYPHFMEGDEGLRENITGLLPDKAIHSSEFIIQPESGMPLTLSAKVQINMHFRDLSNIHKAARFSHLSVPMLWFDITLPKLPEFMDTRFNFYINILPYLDVLGFWGSLIVGVALLAYAVTRATLRMSHLTKTGVSISDGKYGKANLLRSTATHGNNVYNPCEMKLLQTNEKKVQLPLPVPPQEHVISRHAVNADDDEDASMALYADMVDNMQQECRQPLNTGYVLEMAPAMLVSDSSSNSSSGDESTDSEGVIISRNSLASSSYMAAHNDARNDKKLNKRQSGSSSSGFSSTRNDVDSETLSNASADVLPKSSSTNSNTALLLNSQLSWPNGAEVPTSITARIGQKLAAHVTTTATGQTNANFEV